MEVTAKLRGASLSAQKARLVADQVRGKPVAEALDLLTFSPKKAAKLVKKVLQSAIANAEENNGMDIDELRARSSSISMPLFSSAFAMADCSTFLTSFAAFFGEKVSRSSASATGLPRTWSATKRAFWADKLAPRSFAVTSISNPLSAYRLAFLSAA